MLPFRLFFAIMMPPLMPIAADAAFRHADAAAMLFAAFGAAAMISRLITPFATDFHCRFADYFRHYIDATFRLMLRSRAMPPLYDAAFRFIDACSRHHCL